MGPDALSRSLSAVLLTAVVVGAGACRDSTTPTEQETRVDASEDLPRQLTFSLEDDRGPSWSPQGDSIYYAAPGTPPFAEAPGLLLRLPLAGGPATPVFPEVQALSAPQRWLTSPTVAPGGESLAYAELWSVGDGVLCAPIVSIQCSPAGTDPEIPFLREIFLRVRGTGSVAPVDDEPLLRVAFEGQELVPNQPVITYDIDFHPFHQVFNDEGSRIFRPSWAPDGERIVFSDGLRLLVWEVGSTDPPVPIPGTDDGVHPAWSPDGSRIAFTRLEHGPPVASSCVHSGGLGPACQQLRTFWPLLARRITLIAPDGSGATDVGPGDQPAWTPDGNRLVFRRGGELVVASPAGGLVLPLEGGEGGAEPAVSPDGRLVAFSKVGSNGSYDLWVTLLDQELP